MKDDEKKFFRTCYRWWSDKKRYISFRDIIRVVCEFIPVKRCHYLLMKWDRLGFYDYGVAMDLGWFYPDEFPERYRELITDLLEKEVEADGQEGT